MFPTRTDAELQVNRSLSMFYFLGIVLVFLMMRYALESAGTIATVPYSQFEHWLEKGRIASVRVSDDSLTGTLRDPREGEKKHFITNRVDPDLAALLNQHQVEYSGTTEDGTLSNLLSWVMPVLLFFGVWMLLMRFMGKRLTGDGAFMSVGRSKAKVYVESGIKTTFKDVAGVDEAKEELEEIIGFLKDPEQYSRLGARLPRGILLVGPPGTGKTLLARAVAGEAAVPFFSISGSEFVEMFVGVGAARVRDLFEKAREKSPCIIFIDELDALGKTRRGNMPGSHDEKEQTLNQLLVELDGFDPGKGIVLLAATNRPETLDPALLRSGRFDRQILVDLPDRKGREDILSVHLRRIKKPDPDLDPGQIAALTTGFSGADLENLVNEAAVVATRRNGETVTSKDFSEALERIVAGLEKKNRVLGEKERSIVAWHESGHAVVACSLPGTDQVQKISIVPRGIGALGYTLQRPSEDRYLVTRDEMEGRIAVLLGGRAAELLAFEHLSSGAADDLVKATNMARSMVVRYGMVPDLGSVAWEQENAAFPGFGEMQRQYSESTAKAIDKAVRDIVDGGLDAALSILRRRRQLLDECARRLLEQETLTSAELKELLVRFPQPAGGDVPTPRDVSPSPGS